MTDEKIPTPGFVKVLAVLGGLVFLWGLAMTTGGSGQHGWHFGASSVPPGVWMIGGASLSAPIILIMWAVYEHGWKDRKRTEPPPQPTNPPPFRG